MNARDHLVDILTGWPIGKGVPRFITADEACELADFIIKYWEGPNA